MTSCTKCQYIKNIFHCVINMYISPFESVFLGDKDGIIFKISGVPTEDVRVL